jgi:hypothetical protein
MQSWPAIGDRSPSGGQLTDRGGTRTVLSMPLPRSFNGRLRMGRKRLDRLERKGAILPEQPGRLPAALREQVSQMASEAGALERDLQALADAVDDRRRLSLERMIIRTRGLKARYDLASGLGDTSSPSDPPAAKEPRPTTRGHGHPWSRASRRTKGSE